METKQEIRSFGSNTASILLCLVGLFLQACEPGGPDRHGKTPEDVVTAFIQAVQAEDWILAATFWEANSIVNLEANFKMPFKDYCTSRIQCASFKFVHKDRGKSGSVSLGVQRKLKSGATKPTLLFLKQVKGKWRLAESRW